MGKVVRYRPQHAQSEWTASLGMIVFLGSWGMMFGALFFSYGIVRVHATMWPPPDLPALPLVLPGVNTVALAASSLVLRRAERAIAGDDARRAARAIAAAALLGSVFLGLQLVVWLGLYEAGLTLSTGTYASVFYLMTCFHALHVMVGLVALAWLAVR